MATAPPVPKIASGREAVGVDGCTGALLATPVPIMAELVWDRLPQSTVHLSVMAQGPPLLEARDQTHKGPRKALQIRRTPVPSSASGANVGATWLGNVPPKQRL